MKYDPKIIDDYIKSIDYYYFQDFCDRLLSTLYPKEYTPVRAGGRNGDMKNDGYCHISRTFFQAHATRGESAKQTKDKIKEDLNGCLKNWNNIKKFIYITNDTLIGEVENFVDSLRSQYQHIVIETWGHKRLTSEIKKLTLKEIEFVIDRKVIPEVTFLNSDVVSAKFLITNEFNFIKEIAENDLSNFPFENPLLLENKTLKFLRSLIKNQKYRHNEIEKSIEIDKDQYPTKFPDSVTLPSSEGEYQFFYHKRIPKREEIQTTLKTDNISQFLINNGISENKISEINTCYEGECSGAGRFQELYLLRPFYAQFLVLKNISESPIIFKSLESFAQDGVLYKKKNMESNSVINLPSFNIEPSQNIVIPVGLFLSQFKELSELKRNMVTYTYVPNQVQYLHHGSVKEDEIEFIGPSISPKKLAIEFNSNKAISQIHDFSFKSVYWVDRHWQCGSCPHMFFVRNGVLKYQGEIFNVHPDQLHKEKIINTNDISQIIVAELEQETTLIKNVMINGVSYDSEITLNEGEIYSIMVSPNDQIEFIGKYILSENTFKILPINKKKKLIERFKINYNEQRIEFNQDPIKT